MYLGKLMEIGPAEAVFTSPPTRTQALSGARARPEFERTRQRIVLEGDVPPPINLPSGCRFHTLPEGRAICAEQEPELVERCQGHPVACHFADEVMVTSAAGRFERC